MRSMSPYLQPGVLLSSGSTPLPPGAVVASLSDHTDHQWSPDHRLATADLGNTPSYTRPQSQSHIQSPSHLLFQHLPTHPPCLHCLTQHSAVQTPQVHCENSSPRPASLRGRSQDSSPCPHTHPTELSAEPLGILCVALPIKIFSLVFKSQRYPSLSGSS